MFINSSASFSFFQVRSLSRNLAGDYVRLVCRGKLLVSSASSLGYDQKARVLLSLANFWGLEEVHTYTDDVEEDPNGGLVGEFLSLVTTASEWHKTVLVFLHHGNDTGAIDIFDSPYLFCFTSLLTLVQLFEKVSTRQVQFCTTSILQIGQDRHAYHTIRIIYPYEIPESVARLVPREVRLLTLNSQNTAQIYWLETWTFEQREETFGNISRNGTVQVRVYVFGLLKLKL